MLNIEEKLENLLQLLREMETVAVAFSGGVDSSFLAAAAQKALNDKAMAVTAYSETFPQSERAEAVTIAQQIGIRHIILNTDELKNPDFVENTPERCYFCKKERFTALKKWASAEGINWILEGSNTDDKSDYRPGMRAVDELAGVRSPLLETGLTKDEIRILSQKWGISTWNKPSAACLTSRVAYGLQLTAERLKQVEQAEIVIKKICRGQSRVRHHDNLARIEILAEDLPELIKPGNAALINEELRKIGFTYVTVDLSEYRSGSMNDVLSLNSGGMNK